MSWRIVCFWLPRALWSSSFNVLNAQFPVADSTLAISRTTKSPRLLQFLVYIVFMSFLSGFRGKFAGGFGADSGRRFIGDGGRRVGSTRRSESGQGLSRQGYPAKMLRTSKLLWGASASTLSAILNDFSGADWKGVECRVCARGRSLERRKFFCESSPVH